MTSKIKSPRKLIEVALPLDDINLAAAKEKSIRFGHPSTMHLWWARRPLAAARAVIFAQMVNDPGGERGYYSGKSKKEADAERENLFDIIRDLVKWDNSNNYEVLQRARDAMLQSWQETCQLNKGAPDFDPTTLPAFHDPFAGGGAIPLEAQRLGLEAFASDLNPVAVLINKAMIEMPAIFAGLPPVCLANSLGEERPITNLQNWNGARGLAEDVRRYGAWMRDEAFRRIGHLYPSVEITAQMVAERPDLAPLLGEKLTVIAWLWARTVKSPTPAFRHVDVPLVSSYVLSLKEGKEAYLEPIIENDSYKFQVKHGRPKNLAAAEKGTKLARANFACLLSRAPIDGAYIKAEGAAGRMGARMTAAVAESRLGRVYLSPTTAMEEVATKAIPGWAPTGDVPSRLTGGTCYGYGLTEWGKLFTPRQLLALGTFSDLVQEARAKAIEDAYSAGFSDDPKSLSEGGKGATAYGDAVSVYLAMAVSRLSDICNSLCRWEVTKTQVRNLFGRQSIPMIWDFAENNVFAGAAGDYTVSLGNLTKVLERFELNLKPGNAQQHDAMTQSISKGKVISTDPPYYDNIAYADLSDFFYVWLRRSLRNIFPDLFATMAVPKDDELVATAYRHGSKEKAEEFFLNGMTNAMRQLSQNSHPAFPVTIYYAFKQSETNGTETISSGWETFLEAVIRSEFAITGTWPMRTELANRMVASGTNSLASSVVLVCRRRDKDAETISRREFQRELRETMPEALETMIGGSYGRSPIAPVDLAQAAIGPGIGIFSHYASVLNQDGQPMSVHDALVLINREITEFLSPDAGSFDNDTLFCSSWFEQFGWESAAFGEADTLARAKGTSVDGLRDAGVVESGAGKVRLLKWQEYPSDWDPQQDSRIPVWEATHQMIRVLKEKNESEAGALLAKMPERSETIRQLAYYLYTLCERKKWAEEALSYNELITSWHNILSSSYEVGHVGTQLQLTLDSTGNG